jgi:predicted DNA-binding transcriptional regulator
LSFGIVDAFKITETEATITLKDNKSCDDNYLKMIDQNINDVIIYGCLLCLYEKKQNLNIRDITSGKFSVSYAKLNDSVFNLKKTSLNTYLSNLRW